MTLVTRVSGLKKVPDKGDFNDMLIQDIKEIADHDFAVFSQDGFGMELKAEYSIFAMLYSHYLSVVTPRGHFKAGRQPAFHG